MVTVAIPAIKTPTNGTYVYLDAGGEQTIKEWADGLSRIICGGWIDTSAMTQNGTLRIYYKIDNANYRLIDTVTPIAAGTPGIFLDSMFGINRSFKITWQELADEAANRNIPFDFLEI